MKRSEYVKYQAAVANFRELEGIQNLSHVSDEGENEEVCDCCKRRTYTHFYTANGFNPSTEEIQEYTVCGDCLYYAEYGQLDDMTMMDMEEDLENCAE